MTAADRDLRPHLDTPEGTRRFRILLGLIGLVALAVRVYYVATVRATSTGRYGDSRFFYWWPAQQFAKGRGFLSPETLLHCSWKSADLPAHVVDNLPDHLFNLCLPIQSAKHPPGFVVLLSGVYKVGFHSMESQWYVMSVFGALIVVGFGLLVARIINRRAGLIAAAIAAVYPNIWLNDVSLWSETLLGFGLICGLYGVYAFLREPRRRHLLVASVGFTIATSARSEMIVLFVAVLVPAVLARTTLGFPRRFLYLGAAALVPLAMIVPWSIYNAGRFVKPVYLSTGLGPTALAATCGTVYYTDRIGYYDLGCMRGAPTVQPPGMGPDESQVNAIDKTRAIEYAKAHPGRTGLTVVAREARVLEFWNPHQQNVLNHYVQGRGSIRLTTTSQWSFWILSALAVAGAATWRRRRIPLYPLLSIIGVTLVVVAITFGSTRYRASAEWCIIILAATALDAGLARIGDRRSPSRATTR